LTRRRLDQELVRRGLVATPAEARELIDAGRVTVDGRSTVKAETLVAPAEPLAIQGEGGPYASRAGDKLAAALDRFEVDPSSRRCLDAGASSGGFTDVLLARGAAQVAAVDVGYGQLAWQLRTDERVIVLERTNVRDLREEDVPFKPSLVTADLSFISLTKVISALVEVATEDADMVLLVKPQFEAARGEVGAGGVVDDPTVWRSALESVMKAALSAGAGPLAVVASSLPGPAGNVEFFLHARVGVRATGVDVEAALAEGERLRRVRGEAS
jgi:23S rRNA (cytidine1920-2'-O)/16S rRNA (cytidine1409-2'-O)-methyltransferase